MGRYYRIEIVNADGSPVPGFPLTSQLPDGRDNIAAQDIQFDIPLQSYGGLDVDSTANLQISGIPLSWIGQASNLVNKFISIYGGMSSGLPLANPTQQGLLIQGQIWQSFANWIGTSQTLNLFIYQSGQANPRNPVPHILNWPSGTPLSTVITNMLKQNYPGYKIVMNISPNLVINYNELGYYPSLAEYAQIVKGLSRSIMGSLNPTVNYLGVSIALKGKTFYVSDGTVPQNPKQIQFQDMIGQPTWVPNPIANQTSGLPVYWGSVQVQLVLRGDLSAPTGQYITFPSNIVTQTAQGGGNSVYFQNTSDANVSIFQGTYQVYTVRHIGWFRSTSAVDWSTSLVLLQTSSGSVST
jgi:hypothetical protein